MSLTGGKRKVNKSLKAWVAFVKKVQKEEKLSYKDAIHRAKVRKDKGEKWMKGGDGESMVESMPMPESQNDLPSVGGRRRRRSMSGGEGEGEGEASFTEEDEAIAEEGDEDGQEGGRRRRTRRRRRGSRRTMRRRRGSRRH